MAIVSHAPRVEIPRRSASTRRKRAIESMECLLNRNTGTLGIGELLRPPSKRYVEALQERIKILEQQLAECRRGATSELLEKKYT
jgi:hypothetical protein